MTTMDPELAYYVVQNFSHLMNEDEQRAYTHLTVMMKFTHGRSDSSAHEEVKASRIRARSLSDDPAVLHLARVGFDEFRVQTAKRILAEQGDRVFLNCCPQCGGLARTPKARQCRFCGHNWHLTQATPFV
jgi:hypothetical protein